MNADGESLHTGDDERIDCVTSIRAALEEAIEQHGAMGEDVDGLRSALEDCDSLDALLIATIQRGRVAAPTPAQYARFLRASCMHRENLREGQTCGQAFTAECGYCAAATALETLSQPTDAPPDKAGRLMLNTYGRQCWDAGFEAGKLAGVVSPRT